MADTYTTNLNLTKPEPGAAEDTWRISLNADLDALDAIFSSSGTQINLNPNQINFADNKKAIFGTGSDLSIYSDGTTSIIEETGPGALNIQGTHLNLTNAAGNASYLAAIEGGAVTLYNSGSPKLATTSTGIDVTGVITTDGLTTSADINFGDNDKAIFGAGSDLQIYSDGSYSYLQEGSGTSGIRITSDNQVAIRKHDDEDIAVFNIDGAVRFYHDNAQKFSTTSTGIDVTGTVTSDGVSVDGNINLGDNDSIYLGDSNDLRIYHDSGSSLIRNTTGSLYIQDDDGHVYIRPKSGQDGLVAIADGAVTLHHSGNAKLSTTSTGIDITGTVTSDGLTVDDGAFSAGTTGNGSFFAEGAQHIFRRGSAGSYAEFGRFNTAGHLLVGSSNASNTVAGFRAYSGGNGAFTVAGQPLELNRLSSDGSILGFQKDGSTVGSVSVTGSATTYNTSSDARLKDVTGEARGLEVINELNPVAYNWKADGKADEGLIAQEVQEIVPNAVTGSEEEMYQMDYSKLVVHLVKAVKEQQTQIEALQSEINLLKGE